MSEPNFSANKLNAIRLIALSSLCLLVGLVFAAQLPNAKGEIKTTGLNSTKNKRNRHI